MILRPVQFYLAAVLMIACFIGGGSASRPLFEMALSVLAALCFLIALWGGGQRHESCKSAYWIIGIIGVIYALQLLPLPSGLQVQPAPLPSAFAAELLHSWRPLSLSPDATLYSLVSIAPAVVITWLTVALGRKETVSLIECVIAACVMAAFVGIGQAVGTIPFNLYDFYHPRVATGLFASRNHFGDLFLLVTPLLFAVRTIWAARYGRIRASLLHHCILLLFAGAVIASASRASIAIFFPVAAFCYILDTARHHRLRLLVAGVVASACVWGLFSFLPQTGAVKVAADRFEMTEEGRWGIWTNSRVAARAYWPVGAGIANFRLAYEAVEPLEDITPSYVNAAHNEYLQLAIEAGLPGVLAAIAIIVLVGASLFQKRATDRIATYAACALVAMLLHATVDYPFRVAGLNVVIAMLCALCIRPCRQEARRAFQERSA